MIYLKNISRGILKLTDRNKVSNHHPKNPIPDKTKITDKIIQAPEAVQKHKQIAKVYPSDRSKSDVQADTLVTQL